jgi:biotin synthase-related radical SAM superfamily protein
MKKSMLTIAILLSSMIAQAGPVISGGMRNLNLIHCSGENYEARFVLGTDLSRGSLTNTETEETFKMSCKTVVQPVGPGAFVTQVCKSSETASTARLIKSDDGYSAIVVKRTENGYPDPVMLSCERN